MGKLLSRQDFLALISVEGANPNGDPLCGGRPRIDIDGFGIITDVCIKRKLRNTLWDMGEEIFVSPPNGTESLSARAQVLSGIPRENLAAEACARWYDVRAFGQLFAFRGAGADGAALGIKGAVSLQHLFSVSPIEISELPITRCINAAVSRGRAHDTMGFKSFVKYGLYVLKGSVNVPAAEHNGFSEEDCEKLKTALRVMFGCDSSAARPAGSIRTERLYWWSHRSRYGDCSPQRVFDTVKLRLCEGVSLPKSFSDYELSEQPIPGLEPELLICI